MQRFVAFAAFLACAAAAPGGLLVSHAPVVATVHAAPVVHATVPVVGSKTTITKSSQVVNHGTPVVHAVHSAPVVHSVHAAPVVHAVHSAPVVHAVHAAPVVHAVHAAPVVHAVHSAPVVHATPVVVKTPAAAITHSSSSVVHHAPVVHTVHSAPLIAVHH